MSDDLSLDWNEWNFSEDSHTVNTRLYVDNLYPSSTEKDILALFSAYGEVAEINVAVDRTSPNPCGFGFVTMATPEGTRSAIRSLNGKLIGVRILTVNKAYPSEPHVRSPKKRHLSRDPIVHHHQN